MPAQLPDLPDRAGDPWRSGSGSTTGHHARTNLLLEAVACSVTTVNGVESSFGDLSRCLTERLGVDAVLLVRWHAVTETVMVVDASTAARTLIGKAVSRASTVAELGEGMLSAAVCTNTAVAFDGFYHLLATAGLRSAAGVKVAQDDAGAVLLWVADRGEIAPAQVEALSVIGEALDGIVHDAESRPTAELTVNGALSVEQEQLLALGNLARSAGHEINNALAAMLGQAQLLLEELGTDRRGERVRVIMNRCASLMTMARMLEEYGSVRVVEPVETMDLAVLALEAVATTRSVWNEQARARGLKVDLEIEASEPAMIMAAPAALKRALVHLIFNAIQALDDVGGTVRVSVGQRGDEAVCDIADDGCGMTMEVLRMARQPFYTTRPGVGKGMGLSLAESILRQHGGDLQIQSTPGCGTTVTIYLPMATEGAAGTDG
jgi:signal transduction histidine kinase